MDFNISTPVHDFLVKNKNDRKVRCYMPGHKGTENPFDITEIEGADSLYEAENGIIGCSEKNASMIFGTEKTLYSCSGSTLAIQTMLALAKAKGRGKDHVIAGRYSHRSFINTCILLDLVPSWVYPKEYMSCDISPDDIEDKINERTLAVFINSIDYYGGMSDIKAIANICHKHGIPLLVDNAHGAYLKFTEEDKHPITLGADMCCDSAHKTLPVLTGGAYLHIGNSKYGADAKETMSLFGTSSPSYLILDSLDRFNAEITNRPDHIRKLCNEIKLLKSDLISFGHFLHKSDEMRITVDCRAGFSTGFKVADILREFGVECEYADEYKCVLLFGWNTSGEDIETVREIFKATPPTEFALISPPDLPVMIKTMSPASPAKAYARLKRTVTLPEALNKICAEIIAPCPPGIPLVMPGEIITQQVIDILSTKGIKETKITV